MKRVKVSGDSEQGDESGWLAFERDVSRPRRARSQDASSQLGIRVADDVKDA